MPAASLLVLAHHYRPEPNFITAEVAERLAKRLPVTVVTAHPHYPLGRFYPGTRWWWPARSEENGVVVWRVPMVPDHSRSVVKRMISYLSFAIIAGIVAPIVAPRPTIVWVYQGPFTTALASLWFKFVRRSRLVFTCADLWPESFLASDVLGEGMLVRWSLAYRRWMNRQSDLILCSTKGTATQFLSEGIPPERLRHVPVWIDSEGASASPAVIDPLPTVVYAGNFGPAQSLDALIRGAALLNEAGVNVRFKLYGSGSEEVRLRSLARELKADNVSFEGRVSAGEAFSAATRAVGQVVCLRPSPMFRFTVPSKISFSLAAATPVLFALDGEAREIMEASGGGIAFDCEAPDTFAAAVRGLLALSEDERSEMRRSLLATYLAEYQPSVLLARYEESLSEPLHD